jgi:hypothetical protein
VARESLGIVIDRMTDSPHCPSRINVKGSEVNTPPVAIHLPGETIVIRGISDQKEARRIAGFNPVPDDKKPR